MPQGETWVHAKQKIEVPYYSDAPVGSTFLVMAVVEGEKDKQQALIWSTPMKASERSREYISKLFRAP